MLNVDMFISFLRWQKILWGKEGGRIPGCPPPRPLYSLALASPSLAVAGPGPSPSWPSPSLAVVVPGPSPSWS